MRSIHGQRFLFLLAGAVAHTGWALTQEVYVWQRDFSPAVYQAMEAVRGDADGCAILAAEVSWEKGEPRLFRSMVNYPLLAAAARPVGLVLRIGPYSGPFATDDATAKYLADVVVSVIKSARSGGLEPAELQVDFDCASSKLAGYRLWLEAIRRAAGGTRIAFTALPDWLKREEFPALARTADGFILQVHSLEKPTRPDDDFQLCDALRAWSWIVQAGRVGVPFRVALPTYGYRLAFDSAGKFIALSAEGSAMVWPKGTQIRTVRSDVAVVAGLARRLADAKPAGCTGVIWFRLPVAGDRLNWAMVTLKAILHGAVPLSRIEAELTWSTDGLAEVSIVNRGEQDESLPSQLLVRSKGDAEPIVADGLGGYSSPAVDQSLRGVTIFQAKPELTGERIAPGYSRKIGWMRFSHEIPLSLEIVARN